MHCLCFSRVLSADDLTSGYSSGDPDAGDLIYDLRHNPAPVPSLEPTSEPKRSAKVRRTQSLSASTLSLHRSQRAVTRRSEGRGAGRSGSAGRGSGPVDDLGAPASYSSSGHTAAPHHGSSFKRSRPGEVSHSLVVGCFICAIVPLAASIGCSEPCGLVVGLCESFVFAGAKCEFVWIDYATTKLILLPTVNYYSYLYK